MAENNSLMRGVLPILAAACLWGFSYFLMKLSVRSLDPIGFVFGVCFFIPFILIFFQRDAIHEIRAGFFTCPCLHISLSLISSVVGTISFFFGLTYLDLGVATALEKLSPLFTVLLAAIAIHEHLRFRQWFFGIGASLSAYFVAVPNPWGFDLSKSDKLGLFAVTVLALCWAGGNVLGRMIVLKGIKPSVITFIRFSLAAFFLLPFPFFGIGKFPLDVGSLVTVFTVSSLTTAGYILYYGGLKFISAGMASFLELFTTVIGVACGFALLGERFTLTQCAGVSRLLGCIYIISIPAKQQKLVTVNPG